MNKNITEGDSHDCGGSPVLKKGYPQNRKFPPLYKKTHVVAIYALIPATMPQATCRHLGHSNHTPHYPNPQPLSLN